MEAYIIATAIPWEGLSFDEEPITVYPTLEAAQTQAKQQFADVGTDEYQILRVALPDVLPDEQVAAISESARSHIVAALQVAAGNPAGRAQAIDIVQRAMLPAPTPVYQWRVVWGSGSGQYTEWAASPAGARAGMQQWNDWGPPPEMEPHWYYERRIAAGPAQSVDSEDIPND